MQCCFNTVIPEFQTGKVTRYGEIISPGPADVFVFIDENDESIEDGVFGVCRSPDTRWLNLPSDRHGRGANITFADGHARRIQWFWPKKFISLWVPASGQDDLNDLKRLQDALPQRQ